MAEEESTTPAEEELPRYEHECPACIFLGAVEHDDRAFDLYFCEKGHLQPTVIARASSMPHDYMSGIAMAAFDPVLEEALRRAAERNLVPKDYQDTIEDVAFDPFPPI